MKQSDKTKATNYFHYLVEKEDVTTLRSVIGTKAQLNNLNGRRQTPFFAAVEKGNLAILEALLEKGININKKNNVGQTPLFFSLTHQDRLEVSKWLVQNGADLEIPGFHGLTPFLYAILHYDLATIRWLVEHGANVQAKDYAGLNGLMIATSRWKTDLHPDLNILAQLLDWGIDVNAVRTNQRTALHMCGFHNHVEAALFLIERGAKPEMKDDFGKTVLTLAIEKHGLNADTAVLVERLNLETTLPEGQSSRTIPRL